MPTERPTPHRGLLAGLLALVVFASVAIALASGGSSSDISDPAAATPAQTAAAQDAELRRAGRFGDDGDFARDRDRRGR
jgi:hypothetical protein